MLLSIDCGKKNIGISVWNITTKDLLYCNCEEIKTPYEIFNLLDNYKALYEITDIIVEQLMRTNLWCYKQMFFIESYAAINNIRYKIITPKTRCKYMGYVKDKTLTKSLNYKRLKTASVNIATRYNKFLVCCTQLTKYDDVADSIVQGMMFCGCSANVSLNNAL